MKRFKNILTTCTVAMFMLFVGCSETSNPAMSDSNSETDFAYEVDEDGEVDSLTEKEMEYTLRALTAELSGESSPQSRKLGHFNASTSMNTETFKSYLLGQLMVGIATKAPYGNVTLPRHPRRAWAKVSLGLEEQYLKNLVKATPKFDMTHTYFARKNRRGRLKWKRKIEVGAERFHLSSINARGNRLELIMSGDVNFSYHTKPGRRWRRRAHGKGNIKIRIPFIVDANKKLKLEGLEVIDCSVRTNFSWITDLLLGNGSIIRTMVVKQLGNKELAKLGGKVLCDMKGFTQLNKIDSSLRFAFGGFRKVNIPGRGDILVTDWYCRATLGSYHTRKKIREALTKDKIVKYIESKL